MASSFQASVVNDRTYAVAQSNAALPAAAWYIPSVGRFSLAERKTTNTKKIEYRYEHLFESYQSGQIRYNIGLTQITDFLPVGDYFHRAKIISKRRIVLWDLRQNNHPIGEVWRGLRPLQTSLGVGVRGRRSRPRTPTLGCFNKRVSLYAVRKHGFRNPQP